MFCPQFDINLFWSNGPLSKTQLHKIEQLEGFLSSILGPLPKIGLFFFLKNYLKHWLKLTDATIYKKMFGYGNRIY